MNDTRDLYRKAKHIFAVVREGRRMTAPIDQGSNPVDFVSRILTLEVGHEWKQSW
jgi:hypothetical protein